MRRLFFCLIRGVACRAETRLERDPSGIACDAWSDLVFACAKCAGRRIIGARPLALDRFGLLQSIGGFLAPAFRLAYLARDAIQKVFDLLLRSVKIMDKIAAFYKAEFQLREGAQFLETILAQPRRFLRS